MKRLWSAVGGVLLLGASASHADDWGCEVLLCLSNPAGPMAVAQCVPPVRKLFNVLKKGGRFPSCAMGGSAGTGATHEFAIPGSNCPPQYTQWDVRGAESDARVPVRCTYAGVITTYVDGAVTSRIWWRPEGGTVTEPFAGNTQASGTYLADLAAWRSAEDLRLQSQQRGTASSDSTGTGRD